MSKSEIKLLENVARDKILGKYVSVYGNLDTPWFEAKEVAGWLSIKNTSQMLIQAGIQDGEKRIFLKYTPGGNQKSLFITEDATYDVLMLSRKKEAKPFRKEIRSYLKRIRLTGAAIPEGNEEKMVNYYFANLSSDLQGQIVNELMTKNKELQQFYDDLMNTEGLYSINTIGKELNIGLKTLYAYLRGKEIMFYKDNINIPYQRFMNQKLFSVVETPCQDGKYRPVTYATKKGLEYIRKLLRKDGYYDTTTSIS